MYLSRRRRHAALRGRASEGFGHRSRARSAHGGNGARRDRVEQRLDVRVLSAAQPCVVLRRLEGRLQPRGRRVLLARSRRRLARLGLAPARELGAALLLRALLMDEGHRGRHGSDGGYMTPRVAPDDRYRIKLGGREITDGRSILRCGRSRLCCRIIVDVPRQGTSWSCRKRAPADSRTPTDSRAAESACRR